MAVMLGALVTSTVHAEDLLTSQMVDEARMWQSKGRLDLAEDIWRRLLITNARNGAALMGLAQIQIKTNRLGDAEALLSRAARTSPVPAALGATMAMLREAQQRTPTAPTATARDVNSAPFIEKATTAKSVQRSKTVTPTTNAPQAPLGAGGSMPPQGKPALSTTRPTASEPVPPRPVEITVTPIPFRTVQATPVHNDGDAPGPMQLQASSKLLLSASAGAAPPPPSSATKKSKPRPCRPAPALNPQLPER